MLAPYQEQYPLSQVIAGFGQRVFPAPGITILVAIPGINLTCFLRLTGFWFIFSQFALS